MPHLNAPTLTNDCLIVYFPLDGLEALGTARDARLNVNQNLVSQRSAFLMRRNVLEPCHSQALDETIQWAAVSLDVSRSAPRI